MTEQLLKRQIKRYGNDAVRFNLKANRCYAAYKEYGDKNDFLNSQKYYEMSRRAESICNEYKAQLRRLTK